MRNGILDFYLVELTDLTECACQANFCRCIGVAVWTHVPPHERGVGVSVWFSLVGPRPVHLCIDGFDNLRATERRIRVPAQQRIGMKRLCDTSCARA